MSKLLLLFFLRLFAAIAGVGYIHPDAFFQSSEVAAKFVFGYEVVTPWEFHTHSIRSFISMFALSGFPYLILRAFDRLFRFLNITTRTVNAYTLFVAPRLFLFFHSFILDFIVRELFIQLHSVSSASQPRQRTNIDTPISLFMCSWIVNTFLLTPFSNTFETYLFAGALYLLLKSHHNKKEHSWYVVMGMIFSLGVWNRFTFVFFVLPFPIFIYSEIWHANHSTRKELWIRVLNIYVDILFGMLSMAIILVAVDSVFYGTFVIKIGHLYVNDFPLVSIETFWLILSNLHRVTVHGNVTLTPLNNILYNISPDNLKQHGLHPHWLHLVVNMPLLFGPLYFVALFAIFKVWHERDEKSDSTNQSIRRCQKLLAACMMTGLFFLSLAPHQEPRFLIPLLIPLFLLGGDILCRSFRLQVLWVTFNLILLLFFGLMHQGGVVPSLIYLEHAIHSGNMPPTSPKVNVIYYHTYPPPRHLLALQRGDESVRIFDLAGGNITGLQNTLKSLLKNKDVRIGNKTILVTPSTINVTGVSQCQRLAFREVKRFWPHVSFEDPPDRKSVV